MLTRKLHRWPGGGDGLDSGGSPGLDHIRGDNGQGGAQTPADSIRWYEKFPPLGLGFHPACHPRRQGLLLPCVGGTPMLLTPIHFLQWNIKYPEERRDPYPSQIGRSSHPQSHYVHLRELDGLLCCHGKPVRHDMRPDWVPDRTSHPDFKKGCGEIRTWNEQNAQAALEETMEKVPAMESCRLLRGTNTGNWMYVTPSKVNLIDLGDQ